MTGKWSFRKAVMMKKQLNITTLRKEQLTRKGNHRDQKRTRRTRSKKLPQSLFLKKIQKKKMMQS